MSLYVLKFGGSSVATTARIQHVAEIIIKHINDGHKVVVVTSAMQGVTNKLIELTKAFSNSSRDREYDAVISSGEHVAAGLLALAIKSNGFSACSLTSWQVPINVTEAYSIAEITNVETHKIRKLLGEGIIPVITGFQGISNNQNICTIGRGGSDATACAVSKAINADKCFIYTDVDGVYTADPRIVLDAKKISEISYDDMLEMAMWGSKVLQAKSVQIAKEYRVELTVLSSFNDCNGTMISDKTYNNLDNKIVGIAHNLDLFAINLPSDIVLNKLSKYVDMLKIFDNITFAPKDLYHEICKKMEDTNAFDSDVGTVTLVGDCSGVSESDMAEIYDKYDIKHVIQSDRFITFVSSYQNTVPIVIALHNKFVLLKEVIN